MLLDTLKKTSLKHHGAKHGAGDTLFPGRAGAASVAVLCRSVDPHRRTAALCRSSVSQRRDAASCRRVVSQRRVAASRRSVVLQRRWLLSTVRDWAPLKLRPSRVSATSQEN